MEKTLFENQFVKIGNFKLSPSHPRFTKKGFVERPLIVFPGNSIWIQHKNKKAFVTDSSIINLYNQDQEYHRFAIDENGDDCIWVEAKEPLWDELSQSTHKPRFKAENIKCTKQTFLTFQEILKNIRYQQENDITESSFELFHKISDCLYNAFESKNLNTRHRSLVEKIKYNLHNHLHDNYSLQEIAKDVFSSPYHLCRVFKQITGLGINQYRNQIRLNKIYSILVKGTEDLSDLAFQFGYSSHSHLSHNFKQHFGFSPSTINSQ